LHIKKSPYYKTFFTFLILLFLALTNTYAHSPDQSYIFLKIYDTSIDGRFEMTIKDANKLYGYSHPDSMITHENLAQFIPQLQDYVKENIRISVEQSFFNLTFTTHDILKTSAGVFILIDFHIAKNLTEIPTNLSVEYSILFDVDESHEGFLVIEHYWKGSLFNNEGYISLVFTSDERSKVLDLTNSSMMRGFVGVVKQGIKHIWIGIDHILFIIALILPSVMVRRKEKWEAVSSFKPALFYLVKIISLFTIAHSITLSIAAMGIFEMQSRLVESIIAISIAFAAIDIIFPIFRGRIGWVVFGFGLFHGFGFASVLRQLGILGEHMAISLFGFNLGVEIGQLVVIAFVFPVLFIIRNMPVYRVAVLRVGAMFLIIVALYWFVERAFDIELPLTKLF